MDPYYCPTPGPRDVAARVRIHPAALPEIRSSRATVKLSKAMNNNPTEMVVLPVSGANLNRYSMIRTLYENHCLPDYSEKALFYSRSGGGKL